MYGGYGRIHGRRYRSVHVHIPAMYRGFMSGNTGRFYRFSDISKRWQALNTCRKGNDFYRLEFFSFFPSFSFSQFLSTFQQEKYQFLEFLFTWGNDTPQVKVVFVEQNFCISIRRNITRGNKSAGSKRDFFRIDVNIHFFPPFLFLVFLKSILSGFLKG